MLRSERARTLHDAIRALPDRLDEVIERNFFGDESLTDIAGDLGVTLSRVSQMRARALTLLHAAMSEMWEGRPVAADGGVRARNQQRAYLERVVEQRPGTRRWPRPPPGPRAAPPRPPALGAGSCPNVRRPGRPRGRPRTQAHRSARPGDRDEISCDSSQGRARTGRYH